MLVTKIEVQKNNDTRANLYLDDKFFSGISIELVMKEHIKVGSDLDMDFLSNLILEDEKGQALSKAVKYLSGNLKTEKQIKDYLKKKEYSDITINYVLEKMKEYKYLDDEHYAKSYVLTYSNKYGKLKLSSMLKNKGVSSQIIDEVLQKVETPSNIQVVAEKYLKNKEITYENLNKLSRFLYSRGYEFDEINSIVNKIKGK